MVVFHRYAQAALDSFDYPSLACSVGSPIQPMASVMESLRMAQFVMLG